MGLWEDLTSWIDPTIDFVAEALNYEDTVDIGAGLTTAGEYLTSDVKSFFDSDAFGFIREGADALLKSQGYGGKGKGEKMPLVQRTQFRRQNIANQVLRGSRGMQTRPVTSTPIGTGYSRPDVQSYLTALAQNSYNQQMSNMFAQYLIAPTKGVGKKTIGLGTTSVKGTAKKTNTTTRKRLS